MSDCVSLGQFYLCVKENMKDYRGTADVGKIQRGHIEAVKKCLNISNRY